MRKVARRAGLLGAFVLCAAGFVLGTCGRSAPPQQPEEQWPLTIAHPTGQKFEIPSGLPDVPPVQVEVVEAGKGRPVTKGRMVKMHYIGTVPAKGTKYDSSYDRGEPKECMAGVGSVQPGWDLALLQMRAGDHWKVTIPPELAFGPHGGPKVPPRATIEIDIALLEVR